MKHNRSMTLLFALAAACALIACGGEGTTVSTAASEQPPEMTTAPQPDEPMVEIPDELTLNGETVTVMYREQMKDEFWTEALNGEVVNDAVYDRNAAVEERLDCVLEYIPNPSTDWNSGYQAAVSNSVLAGDEAYDIISGPSFHIPTLMIDGYLYNLAELPHVDFDKPWWTQSLLETTAFGDKIYLVSGDISLGMIRYLHCTYFNRSLAADYGFEDLYDCVLDGKWTVEKMEQLVTGLSKDLNGDGKLDLENDQIGYTLCNDTLWRAYIDALDINYMYIGKSGMPEFNFTDQRAFDAVDLFTRWVGSGSSGDFYMGGWDDAERCYKAFSDGRVLFTMGRFIDSETTYRDMEDEYSILPIPKWDEVQEEYHVTINGSESTFGVPSNSSKTAYIGAVMELLAYESYKKVTPAYYETALKIKYTRDDKNAQVIDLIKNGARFNPTVQMSKLLGGTDYWLQDAIMRGQSLATIFEKNRSRVEKKLEEVLSQIS